MCVGWNGVCGNGGKSKKQIWERGTSARVQEHVRIADDSAPPVPRYRNTPCISVTSTIHTPMAGTPEIEFAFESVSSARLQPPHHDGYACAARRRASSFIASGLNQVREYQYGGLQASVFDRKGGWRWREVQKSNWRIRVSSSPWRAMARSSQCPMAFPFVHLTFLAHRNSSKDLQKSNLRSRTSSACCARLCIRHVMLDACAPLAAGP